MLLIYVGLTQFGGIWGRRIMYPIQLLVTYLHEFGHALGALLSGGGVEEIQINQDGSGFTRSVGGHRGIILMGGYIGSAILGNLLFLIGARSERLSKIMMYLLAVSMVLTAVIWFNSFFTSGFLLVFSLALIVIVAKTDWTGLVLMFLGLACVLYIVQDFNVGPSSDLEKYAEYMVVFSKSVWMYIWLAIVVLISIFNLRMAFAMEKTPEQV